MALMLIGMIGCKEKEGKTITNTIEGPKRCCRQVSQQSSYAQGGTSNGEWFWTGDHLDSTVFVSSDLGKYVVFVYTYTGNKNREGRTVTITNGNRVSTKVNNIEALDECGNVLSRITYDENGKETSRTTYVYKCD